MFSKLKDKINDQTEQIRQQYEESISRTSSHDGSQAGSLSGQSNTSSHTNTSNPAKTLNPGQKNSNKSQEIVITLKAEIKRLQLESKTLKNKNEELDINLKHSESIKHDFNEQIQELQAFEKIAEKVPRLEAQLNQKTDELTSLSKQTINLKSENDSLTTQITTYGQKLDDLHRENDKLVSEEVKKRESVEKQLKLSEEWNEGLQDELGRLKHVNSELEMEMSELESENSELKSENSQFELPDSPRLAKIEEVDGDEEFVTTTKNAESFSESVSQKCIISEQNIVEQVTKEITAELEKSQEAVVVSLKNNILERNFELKKMTVELAENKVTIAGQDNTIAKQLFEIERQLVELSGLEKCLRESKDVLETNSESLKNKEQIIKKQNSDMKLKLEAELNLKQQIQALQIAHDERDEEAKELEKSLQTQESILSTTKSDLTRIQTALNDRDSKIDQLQSNLAKMNDVEMSMELHKRQRVEIERKLTAKMTECDELTKALTRLQETSTKTDKSLNTSVLQLQNELDKLKFQHESNTQKFSSSEAESLRLSIDLKQSLSTSKTQQKELTKAESELKTTKELLNHLDKKYNEDLEDYSECKLKYVNLEKKFQTALSQSNVSHKKAKEAEYELGKIKDTIKSLQKTIDSLRRELQKELKSKMEISQKFEKLQNAQNSQNLSPHPIHTRKSSTTSNASSTNTITNQGLIMASTPFQNTTPLTQGTPQNTDGHYFNTNQHANHNSSFNSNPNSPSPDSCSAVQRTASSSSNTTRLNGRNISLVSSRSRSSIGEESTILGCDPDLREANWQYLKHVVLKFILAGNSERDKLENVLCTVLHLTAKEERLLNDTLAYKKNKVFGVKPKVNI